MGLFDRIFRRGRSGGGGGSWRSSDVLPTTGVTPGFESAEAIWSPSATDSANIGGAVAHGGSRALRVTQFGIGQGPGGGSVQVVEHLVQPTGEPEQPVPPRVLVGGARHATILPDISLDSNCSNKIHG